jgi:hypothetical protein
MSPPPPIKNKLPQIFVTISNSKFPGNLTNTATGVIILKTRVRETDIKIWRRAVLLPPRDCRIKQQSGSQLLVYSCVACSDDCHFNGHDMNNRSTNMNIHLTKTQNMGTVNVPINTVAIFPCWRAGSDRSTLRFHKWPWIASPTQKWSHLPSVV